MPPSGRGGACAAGSTGRRAHRDVTSSLVPRRRGHQLGGDTGADFDSERAPPAEPAAFSRVDDARRLADLGGTDCDRSPGVWDRGEKQSRVGVDRVVHDVFGRAAFDHLAGVHDGDAVGNIARSRNVVSYVEK